MFIGRRAARGVVPPKSCAPSSNVSLQFIQSNITYALDFPIHLYMCIYPHCTSKSVPRNNFHRLLPVALAQCLLVVVVRVSQDEGPSSSSRCLLIDLCFCANSVLSWLPSVQQGRSWPVLGDSQPLSGTDPFVWRCKTLCFS